MANEQLYTTRHPWLSAIALVAGVAAFAALIWILDTTL